MGWNGNRSKERWVFYEVDPATLLATGVYGSGLDPSVEWSYFTSLKVSGSVDFNGVAPDESKLLRIVYAFSDDDGNDYTMTVGTFRVEGQTPTYMRDVNRFTGIAVEESRTTGSADLLSVLSVADARVYGLPFTVTKGTKTVAKAKELAESLGLNVICDSSTHVLSSDHTFDADDSFLTIINWLLNTAGFAAAVPDANGYVLMRKYVDPSERTTTIAFSDGDDSIMYDGVPVENDWHDTPNVARLMYQNDKVTVWARAFNEDAEHKASLVNRNGIELTYYDEVSDLSSYDDDEELTDDMKQAMADELVAIAKEDLLDSSADITYFTVKHALVEESLSQGAAVDYCGNKWSGTVTNFKINGSRPISVETKIRAYVKNEITMRIESGWF